MKKITALAVVLLLSLLCCCGKPTPLPDSASRPVRLVFATDMHYLSPSLTDGGEGFIARISNGDGKLVQHIDAITDAFVQEMLDNPPDAIILGGDLTLNGEKQSHTDFAAKLEKLHKQGIPLLVLAGNHDTDNFMAAGFFGYDRTLVESLDQKGFLKLYGRMGYNKALSKDSDSLSYIYPVRSDLWVLLLDVNESVSFGKVSDKTRSWLEEQLAAAQQQGITVVTATHQNILQHNPNMSHGYVIDDNESLAQLMDRCSVPLNLSGHIHIQHIAHTGGFREVTTSSMAVTPCRYGNITFDGSELNYSTQAIDVTGWAQNQGLTDPALLNFTDTASDFFWDTSYLSAKGDLEGWGIDPEHVERMARYYADINTAYFSGLESPRTAGDPDYALWERYERDSFRYEYIGTMLDSTVRDYTSLTIKVK